MLYDYSRSPKHDKIAQNAEKSEKWHFTDSVNRSILKIFSGQHISDPLNDDCTTHVKISRQQDVTMLLFYQFATRLPLTTCCQVVELQDDNKLLEQLVTSLLSSTILCMASCQQAGNKQWEHILLTSCWNSIATSLLQVCYNLCVFTCVSHKYLNYSRKNFTCCSKSTNKPSTSCVRTACPKLSTSSEQAVDNL